MGLGLGIQRIVREIWQFNVFLRPVLSLRLRDFRYEASDHACRGLLFLGADGFTFQFRCQKGGVSKSLKFGGCGFCKFLYPPGPAVRCKAVAQEILKSQAPG